MRPLRVLMVANTLPPADLSGVGEQVLQLAAGLRARGHEVRVLGRGPDGAGGPKWLFPLAVVPALRRAVREFRPDVVQVHESDSGLGALWLRRARRRLAPVPRVVALLQVSYREERNAVRPLVWRGAVLGSPGPRERRFRRWKAPLQIFLGRLTARLADLVLAPSAATAGEIERDYGVPRPHVLPNVTGGLAVGPAAPPAPDLGDGFLLFVGRLRIRKGVEVLLESLTLHRDLPLLVVAGDGEHRTRLEQRATALGLGPDRVRFVGRASTEEVRGLLAGALALVVPSVYEGMPLVILEAMAAGLPVVASRVSGIPEVVEDGATGWLVPCEDPDALGSALVALASDPAAARARGEAGRRKVEREFRPEQAAEIWERWIAGAGDA